MTIRDLYLRICAAIESSPASVKADVDSAFADHQAAANTPAADPVAVTGVDP